MTAPAAAARASASAAAAAEAAPVAEPDGRATRLLRELRPVFYENLILFLGAFLVFAGSIYFAVYFWNRLGRLGPLVAGGLLAVYSLGFAAIGYLLQRRYRAELSARVLYGVATAILPVASTLLGEPTRAGVGIGALAAGAVVGFGAVAYPAIVTAASLFQREIGRPFARAFVVLLWATGLAPLVAASHVRALGVVYVYLAVVPVLAMYRRVREVGRVFERATVIYVVGGSAYMVAAVVIRLALAMSPGIEPAELAPLLVVTAAAAIDLDVTWRQHSRAVRSALGVVGVLAHAAALVAIAIASIDPIWRIATTLSAGGVFAVTALRHRRPSAVHLAIATLAAAAALIAWLPALDPPHGVAFSGLLMLPLSAGLARLGARWRRHAAVEFAAPCELWAVLCPVLASLATLLPLLGPEWALDLGRWSVHAPALVVLPASAAALALAWAWGHRRPYLAGAAIAAAAAVLVAADLAGARALGLAATAACLTLAIAAGAALLRRRTGAAEALLDAALALLATAVVIAGIGWIGPWNDTGAPASVAGYAVLAGAAVAVASQRPRREVGIVAVLAATLAAAAGLWAIARPELIPGLLALGLLALDRAAAGVAIGRARPFRDAYAIALVAVALQAITIVVDATPAQPVSVAGAALVALALLAIAARHASPWPTYGAAGCVLAAAYSAPATLDLAITPRVAAEGAGLALIAVALGLRAWPRLQRWRTVFLDVPLHLAAAAAPLAALRFAVAFAAWEDTGAPHTHALLRRLASPLGLAVLAAITHGSRAHGYLAAAAAVFVLPAVVAAAGLGGDAIAPALAASAVLALLATYPIAHRPAFTRPLARGDLPLRLFGAWPLPSAASHRALWRPPIAALGLLAAVAALGMAAAQAIAAWPTGSATAALAGALVAIYAIVRSVRPLAGDGRPAAALAAHAACGTVALVCAEASQLLGHRPHGTGLVLLGSAYLVLSELLAGRRHPAAPPAARAALAWAIGCLIPPVTLMVHPSQPIAPVGAAILAVAVIRYRRRYPARELATAASIVTTAAGGFAVLWLLGRAGWLAPQGVAVAALAVTAALAAWVHWFARAAAGLGEPFGLASTWALVGGALAAVSVALGAPASAPAILPTALMIAALVLTTAWFGFAAIRTAQDRHGYLAEAALLVLYACVRLGPLGAGLHPETDAIIAIGAAFALHFLSELWQRARLTALHRPAVLGARLLPAGACAIVLWAALSGQGELSTARHAVLAETLGLLYSLGLRRGGHRALGLIALGFYNAGLALLWIYTDRHDPLYYIVPLGVSISLLARIYRSHLSRSARRGLRATGALLIYFATYYQVVQFDHGLPPLLLGGFTLAGIALGFFLELRELFVLSIGFLVLDVISNLTYYGVHRPVLGWTLLTLAGLCLTASGIVFQLRRGQVRSFVAGVRATLAAWD